MAISQQEPAAQPREEPLGTQVLTLLAGPLNRRILHAHSRGPLRLSQLEKVIEWSAQSTLRMAIRNLHQIGALAKAQIRDTPYAVATELTDAGHELLGVDNALSAWLAHAPSGPIDPDSNLGKSAVKALAGGWESHLIRALAARPLSLTELAGEIPDVSYPSLERRLTRMRVAKQVEPAPRAGRGTPYMASEWLRGSVAPFCLAARWEQRNLGDFAGALTGAEIEAILLLALPLASLPRGTEGECLLAVPLTAESPEDEWSLVGATVEVVNGKVVSALPQAGQTPSSWALGTPHSWLESLLEGDAERLRMGGIAPELPMHVVEGIYISLFKKSRF